MRPFHSTFFAQDITFGRGALDQVGAVVERFGWRRLMLCVSARARASGMAAPIDEALGARLVATFTRIEPHVPEAAVAEGAEVARSHNVDALIALGGGSAIGVAKAISMALDERPPGSPADQPRFPVLVIPTTYAGSEMTAISGVTRVVGGAPQKVTTTDPRIAPKAVIYDPLLTLDLPPRETAGTALNAIAHCVEALYSITRNPLSSAAALAALPALARSLPRCLEDGADIEAREELLSGAWLAGVALANVTMGLCHGICHVLGGATGAAHGDLNAIMLPHAMRFNRDATASELAPAAVALGVSTGRDAAANAAALTDYIATLAERAPLPGRLRELGIEEERLPALARLGFASGTVQNNPKPITGVAQIEALLRAAW
jgi:maleylacetate reductase